MGRLTITTCWLVFLALVCREMTMLLLTRVDLLVALQINLGDATSVIAFLSSSLPTLFNKQNAWRQTMYEGLQLSCVLADCTSHELSSARDLPYDVQGPCASHAFLSELRL